MSIDGFTPVHRNAFAAFARRRVEQACAAIDVVARRLSVEVSGIENLPEGRALIVANHTFGFDVAFPMAAIFRATGRPVWALGEHGWWRVPFVRRLVASIGVVDGTPENTDRLLSAEQLVLVMPGGLREAMKPRELRYRLLWGHRFGFVRAAIKNRAPVVPLACLGTDEVFDLVGNPFVRGRRWLGRFAIPIPRPARWPHPRRGLLRFAIGAPLTLPALPEKADDPEVTRRCRYEIEGALQELIDVELARREGFELGGDCRSPHGR